MEKHINIIAALHIGLSILGILSGIFVFIILNFAGGMSNDHQAQIVLSIIAQVLIGFIVFLSLPGIIAGIGLFKRKEWARILTLIISVLDLINFPIGTAVGVYSIWALSQTEVVEHFKENKSGTIQN
jgi:predicted membrane-bound dolichyl-phosphate-mannose-protein mannosyltransferase